VTDAAIPEWELGKNTISNFLFQDNDPELKKTGWEEGVNVNR
jgi:hypothetical protein